MKRINKLTLLTMFLLILTINLFSNGLSLNSVGPKSLAMGGAFLGLADDATSLYWNPAGLANQESSANLFLSDVIPIGSYKTTSTDFGYPAGMFDVDAKTKTNHYISPNIFINHRINNLALGFGVYVPAGLGTEYDGKDLLPLSNGKEEKWMTKIGVINFSPAAAYNFNKFSLGIAMNIMYGSFEINRPSNVTIDADGDGTPETPTSFQYSETSTGLGYGVTISGLFHITKTISLGTAFRTKTTVKMKGDAENLAMMGAGGPSKSDFTRDVAWPMWFGAGLSAKPTDRLTINADFQFSQWSDSEDKFKTDFDNQVWSAVTGATGDDTFKLEWKDATQIRFGMEYKTSDKLALRCGYYYDPAPAPDDRINILFPSSTNNVGTAGFGYQINHKLNLDFGLEYLFGADRNIKFVPENGNMPGTHHLDVFAFSFGAGYKF
jgi:long-chain fatty acid transport protein